MSSNYIGWLCGLLVLVTLELWLLCVKRSCDGWLVCGGESSKRVLIKVVWWC